MYRIISFVVIFSIVSILLNYHQQNGHTSMSDHQAAHAMKTIEIPASHPIPTITGSVIQDQSGTWLLHIQTTHFRFTPEKVGMEESSTHEGHAHLYINGKRINRIYGSYYNLDTLKPGTYHIKVTLNGNNHGILTYQGKEIAYTETVRVNRQ